MALRDELLPASFRGVPFLVDSSSISGGRKTATHEYPNSDRRFVEDLGLLNKTFNMQAVITGENYKLKRDALIQAIETKGSGILIHPFFGSLNVVAKPYTLEERMTGIGEARFTLVFENSQEALLPKNVTGTISNVFVSVNQAISLIKTLITQGIQITQADNFLDALSKTNDFIGTTATLTNEYLSDSDSFDTFSKNLNNFSDNTSLILSQSAVLADNIASTFTLLDDAMSTPTDAKNIFINQFNFGEDDVTINLKDYGSIEKKRNRDILNGSIQTLALLMTYRNIVQIKFKTVDEIDRQRHILDDQFEKVISNKLINRSDTSALVKARNQVRQFFDTESLKAFKVEEFYTNETTILELAYRLYGNIDNVQDLINLNNLKDLQHVDGTLEILTR